MTQTMKRIKLEVIHIPGFDSLKMKERIQRENYKRRRHMTPAEQIEDIRQGAARFDEMMRQMRAEREKNAGGTASSTD